jgi:hypothetical protein
MLNSLLLAIRFLILIFSGHKQVALENVALRHLWLLNNLHRRVNCWICIESLLRCFGRARPYLMTLSSLLSGFRGQAALQAENIALRHQLIVLHRSQKPKRLVLKPVLGEWRKCPGF